jgi:hypothetical protein
LDLEPLPKKAKPNPWTAKPVFIGDELSPVPEVSTTSGVKVNESKVTIANIVTTNGVIHVIDTILLPPTS